MEAWEGAYCLSILMLASEARSLFRLRLELHVSINQVENNIVRVFPLIFNVFKEFGEVLASSGRNVESELVRIGSDRSSVSQDVR